MSIKQIISLILLSFCGIILIPQVGFSMRFDQHSSESQISALLLAGGSLKPIASNDLKAIDIHKLKEDFVGADVSKFDTYVDNNGQGDIVLVKKSDSKVQVQTDLSVPEAKSSYPAKK